MILETEGFSCKEYPRLALYKQIYIHFFNNKYLFLIFFLIRGIELVTFLLSYSSFILRSHFQTLDYLITLKK